MADIDISSLYRIDTKALAKMSDQEFATVLSGTDLVFNTKTKKIEYKVGDQIAVTDRRDFVAQIETLVKSDGDGNKQLTTAEVRSYLDSRKKLQVSADNFAQVLAGRIDKTYKVIANNLAAQQGDTGFFISTLREYNLGLKEDEIRQAHEITLARPGEWQKSAGNVSIPFYAAYKGLGDGTGWYKTGESWYPMDNVCTDFFIGQADRREKAIDAL